MSLAGHEESVAPRKRMTDPLRIADDDRHSKLACDRQPKALPPSTQDPALPSLTEINRLHAVIVQMMGALADAGCRRTVGSHTAIGA